MVLAIYPTQIETSSISHLPGKSSHRYDKPARHSVQFFDLAPDGTVYRWNAAGRTGECV